MKLTDLETMDERLSLMKKVVQPFKKRAHQYDQEGSFPFENFKDLQERGYPSLTVPKEYGGLGISLYEMLKHQEIIAQADASTALAIGWHMGVIQTIGENKLWDERKYKQVVQDVFESGALINNSVSERATGSPDRGGKPETTATQIDDGWVISGRKTFTTMAPILTYFNVSATIEGTDQVGNFLIHRDRPGVTIEETWDSIAMKATGSHDLVLENVSVAPDDLVSYRGLGKKSAQGGWLLHIPACYLGIAKAAQHDATQFATHYSPNSITGTISELPNVKQKLGEIQLLSLQSSHFLYGVARKWDESCSEEREAMNEELSAAKLGVVNGAMKMVDLAMRVVGARSLSETNPLQRYYRDVRAGLHNPPMEDVAIIQLAEQAIREIESTNDKSYSLTR